MATLLEQLQAMTVTVADTGDFKAIAQYRPRDATTNPTLVMNAAKMPRYRYLVDQALSAAARQAGAHAPIEVIAERAAARLPLDFGMQMLAVVPGRVSTELDARHAEDRDACIALAREVIRQYEASGASRERILIRIASTWEGIRAAEVLEREGIHCNMTLLFGMHQAVAAAEAGATLVSPFVGRILDWYRKDTGRDYAPADDPGVASVTRIYNYFKHHGHRTQVMGASFRNIGEILELAGCDYLTISTELFAQLAHTEATLVRKLDATRARAIEVPRIVVDEARFREMHAQDRMARDKLAEGIAGFAKAGAELEAMLRDELAARAKSRSA